MTGMQASVDSAKTRDKNEKQEKMQITEEEDKEAVVITNVPDIAWLTEEQQAKMVRENSHF